MGQGEGTQCPTILLEREKLEFGEAEPTIAAEENAQTEELTQRNSSRNVHGCPLDSWVEGHSTHV